MSWYLLEGRRVVHTVTSYSNNLVSALAAFDDDQLLLRGGTRKHNLSGRPLAKKSQVNCLINTCG